MTRKLRDLMNQIDDILVKGTASQSRRADYQKAIDLWAILTALRGPDNGRANLKDRYTAPIRSAAFPQMAKHAVGTLPGLGYGEADRRYAGGVQFAAPATPLCAPQQPDTDDVELLHFLNHIQRACEALNRTDQA